MKRDKDKMREYEVEFQPGPLGITIQPQYVAPGDFPIVRVLRCIPNQQAENFAAISEGDQIIAIRGLHVDSFLEYSELIKFLKEAPRPLKIRFASPLPASPAERVRESIQAKLDALERALERDEIQMDEIKAFARAGLPDRHRALVWKLLLGNLPLKRSEWPMSSSKQRDLYDTYTRDMFASHARKDADPVRPQRMEGQAWYEQSLSEENIHNKNLNSSVLTASSPSSKSIVLRQSSSESSMDKESPSPKMRIDTEFRTREEIISDKHVEDPTPLKKMDGKKGEAMEPPKFQTDSLRKDNRDMNDISTVKEFINSKAEAPPTELLKEQTAEISEGSDSKTEVQNCDVCDNDEEDPLASNNESQLVNTVLKKKGLEKDDLKEYDDVEDILDDDIWKDVQRTHPGYHFFTLPNYVKMHRILYIYGRLNAGVSYVQGMNEILAPIVYVFGAYPSSDQENFEADSFFCFASLMSDVRDMFIRSLDVEKSGLHGQISRLEEMVKRYDPPVAAHLQSLELHFQFFSVRWLTTLLTREFELPDALRLWDSMLGSPKRFTFILCCCTAMILARRDFLLENDFPTCLKALQAPCTVPVEHVLMEAERLSRLEKSGVAKGRVSLVRGRFPFSAPKLANVEGVAGDFIRAAARAAKTALDEARAVVEELNKEDDDLGKYIEPLRKNGKPAAS